MKRLLFILFILTLYVPLQAQRPLQNKVILQNGTVLRGRIVDAADSDSVRIKTADGRFYSYALNEVKEMGKTPWKERRLYPFDRSKGIFLRPEFGLGYGGTIALSAGFQFNPYYSLYWGCGTWQKFDRNGGDRCHSVFIGNLVHFSNNKNSVFVDFKAGLGIRTRYHCYREGGIVSLGIGRPFGIIDIGLYGSLILNPLSGQSLFHDALFSLNIAYNLRKAQ